MSALDYNTFENINSGIWFNNKQNKQKLIHFFVNWKR